MKIERVAPILTVRNLATAIADHTNVLGMRVMMDMSWVAFLSDDTGHQIGLMTTDATATVNPDVSIFVDDVEGAHTPAVESGVEIVHPLTTEEWGCADSSTATRTDASSKSARTSESPEMVRARRGPFDAVASDAQHRAISVAAPISRVEGSVILDTERTGCGDPSE